ncbi:hypothetical protein [Mangrovibacterium marinum]|uniref:Uncharacterized protein n=1 Tax=Mangrovibacterium marinum TaxID=1639118 RepID=A0A2T5C1V2_9BACT|nr:hypothetical protein [Mangrovibacterium marinum]PTN08664.1 hypothetical protein C8N47_10719 [Mangrovibacterium marinum]
MKVRKYMNRKTVYRLLLGLAVVLSAVLFDAYHQGSTIEKSPLSHSESSQNIISTPEFCVNPASTFRLIHGADKLFSGLVFAGTRSDLLAEWHNNRSFHFLKAESLNREVYFLLSAHFMKFNCCHHSNPDDSSASA